MAQRTFTVTLDFDDETTEHGMDRVVKDLQSALYATVQEGNRNSIHSGYKHLDNMGVK